MQEQRTAGQGVIEGKKSVISDEGVDAPVAMCMFETNVET